MARLCSDHQAISPLPAIPQTALAYRWYNVIVLTIIIILAVLPPVSCGSTIIQHETASIKFSNKIYDVTRVDDILIPQKSKTENTRDKSQSQSKVEGENYHSGRNDQGSVSYFSNSEVKEKSHNQFQNLVQEENEGETQHFNAEEESESNRFDKDDITGKNKNIHCEQGIFSSSTSNFTSSACISETNGSLAFGERRYSPLYNTVACTLSAIIFVFGLLGNILVIIVISRTRSMHTTTNCYLLSLSVADSLVLVAATLPAIPETFFRVDEWPYGRAMCSMLIFLQYLGVDSSSLSITAFTIERYIAICHPMRAQTMCTLSRAKKIIAALWSFTILYCSPWLGLTEIKVYSIAGQEPMYRCQHRLARSSYLLLYMIDLILFYVIPLIIAIILYLLIGRILFFSRSISKNIQFTGRGLPHKVSQRRTDSRVQVVRMLVVVVFVFATLWMPYRVMVVYNSFAQHKYMDLWFLLFARTMVYTNCAINPILYNIMSVKFKRAFRNYLSCWHRRESLPPNSYNEMNTDVLATRRNTNNTTVRNTNQQHHQLTPNLNQHQKHHHNHPHLQQPMHSNSNNSTNSDNRRFNNNNATSRNDSAKSGNSNEQVLSSSPSSCHSSNNTSQKQTLLPHGHPPPQENVVYVHQSTLTSKDSPENGSGSSSVVVTSDACSSSFIENAV